ncbi:PREDICTED: protein ROOT HAIR DEFECTIVE 3-like isoform X1 [Nelumbo nucifera]|uniref:Protein ROOT HAIR DEFECTIVE 3-like isoform X1 n=1 Tax=Nelumbo nucifera TaxID=4432 RepID=A0A1U8A4Y6_NELNU|nr:PREDICTED: protein ROOT HAIR DEFECTIVE 3-like isoform X1 [Nelumbo nucifera]
MAEKKDVRYSTQLIEEEGIFNDKFSKILKLDESGSSYVIISIMGPQSSGKSTLLNHLFGTNFKEMKAEIGRNQTTKGIWLAKCTNTEPYALVADLEGNDGTERGESDTAFEKQIALFALAISDAVIVNMWCHDVGRIHGANTHLLTIVFQVMMQLFSGELHKRTIFFILRDKTKTPLDMLKKQVNDNVEKIWDSIQKPKLLEGTRLNEYFDVQVDALSSYEREEEEFKIEVSSLKNKIFQSIAKDGCQSRYFGVDAATLSISVEQMWKTIKENKELDIPAHKIMVSSLRCDQIVNGKFESLKNQDWVKLHKNIISLDPSLFGEKLVTILNTSLSQYDNETIYFDESVRAEKRESLKEKALQLFESSYQGLLDHQRCITFGTFKKELDNALNERKTFALSASDCTERFMAKFNEICTDATIPQANWDSSVVRLQLQQDMGEHVTSLRETKLAECNKKYKKQLKGALTGPVNDCLQEADDNTWPTIKLHLERESKSAVEGLTGELDGFDIDDKRKDEMLAHLEDYARGVVEKKAKEEASRVLKHMHDRFLMFFTNESKNVPRIWTGEDDVKTIAEVSRLKCLKLLAIMAAIRWGNTAGNIEATLYLTLVNPNGKDDSRTRSTSSDPLAKSTWEEDPTMKTLIAPSECKTLWIKFQTDTDYIVNHANSVIQAIQDRKHAELMAKQAREEVVAAMEKAEQASKKVIALKKEAKEAAKKAQEDAQIAIADANKRAKEAQQAQKAANDAERAYTEAVEKAKRGFWGHVLDYLILKPFGWIVNQ